MYALVGHAGLGQIPGVAVCEPKDNVPGDLSACRLTTPEAVLAELPAFYSAELDGCLAEFDAAYDAKRLPNPGCERYFEAWRTSKFGAYDAALDMLPYYSEREARMAKLVWAGVGAAFGVGLTIVAFAVMKRR